MPFSHPVSESRGTCRRLFLVCVCALLLSACGGGGGGGGDGDTHTYAFGLGFLQYRTYEDSPSTYRAWVTITKDGAPIQESDIGDANLLDSAGNPLEPADGGFTEQNYLVLNCTVTPCQSGGSVAENGLWAEFADLPPDTYRLIVDMVDGQTLAQDIPFQQQPALPTVPSGTMQAEWVDGNLVLSWDNPTLEADWAAVDQLRVVLLDDAGNSVLYARAGTATETITISGGFAAQAAVLGSGMLARWEVQTRAYESNRNTARGYSSEVVLPAQ